MTRLEATILRAAALWTVYVWVTRIVNIVTDPVHSAGFKVVHSALALISVLFAAAIWYVARRGRRRVKGATGE